MPSAPARTGRDEVTEYIHDAYRTSSDQNKAPSNPDMWTQPSQRDRLKRLSPDARTPVLHFLKDRPSLIRSLQSDSPHLGEAFKLAVDAIGQPYESEQWETLAEILMEACVANPAASMELHEVLYGVITPAGQGFWVHGAIRKLMQPFSNIAGAFRNNQPRDLKQSVSRSAPDSDDFQIGTSRSDSTEWQPQAEPPAAAPVTSRLPPSQRPASNDVHTSASKQAGAADVKPLAKPAVSSSMPASAAAPSASSTDSAKKTEPMRPAQQVKGYTAQAQMLPESPSGAPQAISSAVPSSQLALGVHKQPSAASTSGRQQPTVQKTRQASTHKTAKVPEASTSQPQPAPKGSADQDVAETQTKISTTPYQQVPADQPPTAPMSMEALSKKNLERQPTGPTAAGASPSSGLRPPLAPSKPAPSAAKPPLPPPPSDTGADMEPFFPMPIRTSRVSVALPGRERSVRQRATAVDPFVASLPDPKKMTDKELADFDVVAAEQRYHEYKLKIAGLPTTLPMGLSPGSASSSSAHPYLTDAHSPLRDLPSLSNWLSDPEAARQHSQTGASSSRAASEASVSNGLPPPSVPQAQHTEHTIAQASVIPSRVDQLRSRSGPAAASQVSLDPAQSKANPLAIVPATAAAKSAAEGSDSEDEQAASVLEELMLPAQRKPYREFKRSMEARAKSREISRLRGEASTLPDMAPGAVPSLEAARAALENFQRERMATLGSVSEPLARAQAQLAELEASLAKDSLHPLLPLDPESTPGSVGHRLGLLGHPETTISEAARPHLEAARRARDARKAAWAAYKERDANLPEDFKRRMDEVYNPSEEHTAAVAAAVKLGVEDFRAGRVATRSEGVRARVSEVYRKRNQLPCWDTLSAASGVSEVSQEASLQGSSSTSAVCPSLPPSGLQLSPVAESSSPAHPDPEVDTPERMDSPPLGSVPVWPPLRGFNRPNLRPGKTRVSSRPGRGPVPVPSTTHPDARPFGVARSSLALREQAQLHAQNPGALLMAPRHKQPAREPDRPEKLPSPEAAVNLLAQVHSAEKRFETTLPNGKLSIPAVIPAAAVLGADAVDKTLAAKFIKERTVAPSNAAPKSTKPTAKGSVPQPKSALPQVAPLPTIAEHPVTTAAATEPASDVAAALAVHKLKKAPGAGVEAQPSRAAQPPTPATPASQLLAHFPREAQANQDATADPSASAAQDSPASASASSLATPAAAAPPASSSVAPAAASASAGQPEAHQAQAEPTAEGSLTPLGVDPESPTGEQDPINKQGKQRMGKKQRQRLRQEMEAKAAEDEAKAAEEARIQAEKDAEQAAKDAVLAEKRRAVQERVDKAQAERAIRDAAAAAWKAAQAAEQAAQAAKDSAPAAEEVHDAAAQAAAEEAKQAKKQAKKQRQREEAKAAKAAAARAADQGPKGATQAQDQAEPSRDAAAAPPHADSPPQSAAPAVAAGSQAESSSATQPTKPSEQDGNTAQSVAAEIQSVTTSRAGSDSLPPASPAAPSESSSIQDSLLPRPNPGKKRAKAGKPKDAPVAMPDVDPEVAHEAANSSQQQATEPVERSASSDAFSFLDDLADESTDVDQQQLASAAEEDFRPAMRDSADEVTDNWTVVPAGHRRQHAEAVQESVADRTTVGGNQQRRPPAAAHYDPEDDETETARYRQERHPVQSPQAQANANEQDADLEEPAEGSEDDHEDVIGLAALANAPPQRRRGVRAGRRHKKKNLRERAYDTTSPDNEPSGGPGYRPRAHHLPRSPLAGGHGDVGSPVRAGVGPALLPGPSMTWAAAAAGHGRVPAVASDALPIDHAQAVVRQLLAQQQEESAGAAELEFGERPKPKPRVGPIAGAAHHRIPATTSDAVAAATAAAAAATAGIVRPHRQKGAAKAAAASPAPWGYAGNGDGAWEAAEPPPADSAPAQPGPGGESSLMPITEAAPPPAAPVAATNPDLEIPAAELVAMLKAELDSDTFNCPLTLDEFTDPVKAADGRTYDRLAITEWLSIKDICPFTNEPMPHKELVADRDTARRLKKLKRRLAGATKRVEAEEP